MKRKTVLCAMIAFMLIISSAAYAAAGDTHPFSVLHLFMDIEEPSGFSYKVLKSEDTSFTVTEGEEFWVENLSGNGTQFVNNAHIDGYDDSGRWKNYRSDIFGGDTDDDYGSGRDADGKIFMYRNRYVGLPLNDGGAEYSYCYQAKLIRKYTDGSGSLITGENGSAPKDKDGKTVANPAASYHDQGTAGSLKVPEFLGMKLRGETLEGDPVVWNEKNQCWTVRIDLHKESDTMTFVYDRLCTVTYTDGTGVGEIFPDQVLEEIPEGSATPSFEGGTPERKGWVFAGWSPAVSDTVTGDVTYTAQWEKAPAALYTVTYTDGAGGKVFPDQVTKDLPEGSATPAFEGGKPVRESWVFKGWSPAVSAEVHGNAVYVAKWEKEAPAAVPATGDTAAPGLYLALLSLSAAAAVLLRKQRRKEY